MDGGKLISARSLQNHLEKIIPDYTPEVSEWMDTKLAESLNKRFGTKNKQFIVIDKDNIYLSRSECSDYVDEYSSFIEGLFK